MSVYQPLPTPSSIRLLIIHPGAFSDELKCNLKGVNLEDSPYYETLSYTWGLRDPSAKIQVDGMEVEVTPNPAAALRRIRAGPRKSFTHHDTNQKPLEAREIFLEPELLEENITG